jgi:hypothetical protein
MKTSMLLRFPHSKEQEHQGYIDLTDWLPLRNGKENRILHKEPQKLVKSQPLIIS